MRSPLYRQAQCRLCTQPVGERSARISYSRLSDGSRVQLWLCDYHFQNIMRLTRAADELLHNYWRGRTGGRAAPGAA